VLGIGAGPYVGQESNVYDFLNAKELETLGKTTSLLRGPTQTYFTSDVRRLKSRKLLCDALDIPLFEPLFRNIQVWDPEEGRLQFLSGGPGEAINTMRSFLNLVLHNSIMPTYDRNNQTLLGNTRSWPESLLFQYCELGLLPSARVVENFKIHNYQLTPAEFDYTDLYIWSFPARHNTILDFREYLRTNHSMEFDSLDSVKTYMQTLQGVDNTITRSQEFKDLMRAHRCYIYRYYMEEDIDAYFDGYAYTGEVTAPQDVVSHIYFDPDEGFGFFLMRKITQQLIKVALNPDLCQRRPRTLPTLSGRKREREEDEEGGGDKE
jgi:hypothetical protein